jgi:hypothetical protein
MDLHVYAGRGICDNSKVVDTTSNQSSSSAHHCRSRKIYHQTKHAGLSEANLNGQIAGVRFNLKLLALSEDLLGNNLRSS